MPFCNPSALKLSLCQTFSLGFALLTSWGLTHTLDVKISQFILLLNVTAFSIFFIENLLLVGFQSGGQIPIVVSSGSSKILCLTSDSASLRQRVIPCHSSQFAEGSCADRP